MLAEAGPGGNGGPFLAAGFGALPGELRLREKLEVRYRAGSIALQIWLDAQETRRQDENALEQNRLNLIENYVTLCKALGSDATTDQKR